MARVGSENDHRSSPFASLSGGFNPFIPVSRDNGTSGAKGYCLRWLDLAPFGPLFELSPPDAGAGRSVWKDLPWRRRSLRC
jgi:hypothetical protein